MPPRLNQPDNHALPSDDSDLNHYWFEFVFLTRPESKNREMQGDDDFLPFFRLIVSTVERSQLRKELEPRDIQSSSDQGSFEEEDRESYLTSKSNASHDSRYKESER